MMFSFILVIFVAVVIAQLVLCFGDRPLRVRVSPAILICVGELSCLCLYAASVYLESVGKGIYGAAFAAVIYAAVFVVFLLGDGLAWGIWGICYTVQKRRK